MHGEGVRPSERRMRRSLGEGSSAPGCPAPSAATPPALDGPPHMLLSAQLHSQQQRRTRAAQGAGELHGATDALHWRTRKKSARPSPHSPTEIV
mmetsp:Transcript_22677/g.54598  ORF Transcript_22677/g.54598 Transcript_22677/m.54598 type:complete len:94 (+) Transcript_22677:1118-1399(+)